MNIRKLSIVVCCVFFNTQIFSMAIKKGEKYLNTYIQEVVTVKGSCKEIWGIDGLTSIGNRIEIPAIHDYLTQCIRESKETAMDPFVDQETALKAILDPCYHGEFYYVRCDNLGFCAHPSWLAPVKEVALNKTESIERTQNIERTRNIPDECAIECATWFELEEDAADVKEIWPWAYDETSDES